MRQEPTAPHSIIVIFGATGDLTRRKLLPALYRLAQQRLVPSEFAILGTGRQPYNDDQFRETMKAAVTEFGPDDSLDETAWQSFAKRIFYVGGDFNDASLYGKLKTKLEEIDKEYDTEGNRIFYLATAPDNFGLIAKQLGAVGIARPAKTTAKTTKTAAKKSWTRIIVEKPFGHDLESARALNKTLASVFDESQIYRIDHYLGKETVQNLLVFRFAGGWERAQHSRNAGQFDKKRNQINDSLGGSRNDTARRRRTDPRRGPGSKARAGQAAAGEGGIRSHGTRPAPRAHRTAQQDASVPGPRSRWSPTSTACAALA